MILAAVGGIAILLFLVIRTKLQAFAALLLVSILIGLAAEMPLGGESIVLDNGQRIEGDIIERSGDFITIQTGDTADSVATFDADVVEAVNVNLIASITAGMGGTLGFVAVVVGLGAMFGQMLEASGGAESLARRLLQTFGEDKASWSMSLAGFLVAIPVFFDVGFVILMPLVYGLTRKSGRPVVYYAIPLLAGLAVTHAFIPPTPGPIVVAGILGAELGWVILFGVIVGLPCAIVAGPLFGRYIARKVQAGIPEYMDVEEADREHAELPSFGLIAALILLPLVLILANTVSGVLLGEQSNLRAALGFIGHPFVALLLTTLLCFRLLGTARGYSRQQVQDIATKALEPAGIIILITGAGGVLKQVLIDSGVGGVIQQSLAGAQMPLVLLAFIVAALVRIMQGSATVAMIAGAGLVAPIIEDISVNQPTLALTVLAIAAGATTASHVNDSGFWLVNRYLGLSVEDTLRSWTVATTIIAFLGLAILLALSVIV